VLLPGAHLTKEDWTAVAKVDAGDQHSLIIAGGRRELPKLDRHEGRREERGACRAAALSDADAKRWGNLRPRVPEANVVEGVASPKRHTRPFCRASKARTRLIRWTESGDVEDDEANPACRAGRRFPFPQRQPSRGRQRRAARSPASR
jgi:hypothetical protein